MAGRCCWLFAGLIISGCIHRPSPVTPASLSSWNGRENLTLDQISPVPRLGTATTHAAKPPPVEALLLYGQARDASARGQPLEAVDCLNRAIVLDPYRFDLRYDLGWAYVRAGNADENAISAFEKAAALEPDHLPLQTELGRLYLAKADLQPAMDHLRIATQTSAYASDDGNAAIADLLLARALQAADYDRAALNQYGVLMHRFANPSDGLQSNSELVYLLSQPDALFVEVGELMEKHGQYADAIRSFKPAVDREPDNFELQARYARDLARDGQRDPALSKAVDLVVRNRATSASLGVLRDVCSILNLPDGDVRTLQKLNADRPFDSAVLFALTDTLIARHRSGEAQQLLESAWEKSPGDIPITRRLFAMDKQQGARSARLLIDSLAMNPDAVENYLPLWNELLRPGSTDRLSVAEVSRMKLPAAGESARQFLLASAADDLHRPAMQHAALEASIKAGPFAPAYRELLNMAWDHSGQIESQKNAASNQLAAAAKAAGDSALAEELTGRALQKQKLTDQAMEHYAQAIRLGGQSADLMLAAAVASRIPGRDPKFEQRLWKLIGDRPLYKDGYAALVHYYTDAETGSVEQATKVLSVWLANDPQSVNARVLQVEMDMQQGQTHDAEQEITGLFTDDPDDPEVFGIMSKFYSQTGRVNELITRLEGAVASHPRDTDLMGRLASLYIDQKRNTDAIRLLDSTRTLVADDADLLFSLRNYYGQLDPKQVDDLMQQIIALDPHHPGASNNLGFVWADQGKNLAQAEALIRTAVAAEPDNYEFLDSLGWVLYKRGKFDEARQYLQQAVGSAAIPDSAVLDHLGDTLYRLAKTDEAQQAWQQSLKGLGDVDENRLDLKQLRLQLLQKIKQVEAKRPVDL